MLEPKKAKALMSNSREVREFVATVQEEIDNLNTLDGIKVKEPVLVAIEVQARQLAKDKLIAIIDPLLNIREESVASNKDDYTVDVK